MKNVNSILSYFDCNFSNFFAIPFEGRKSLAAPTHILLQVANSLIHTMSLYLT